MFANGYRLKSLEKKEAIIKASKHLPNIPVAGIAEKGGFAHGDMQQGMIEKNRRTDALHDRTQKRNQCFKTAGAENAGSKISLLVFCCFEGVALAAPFFMSGPTFILRIPSL
ncbi:MAG: hypothetical protein ABIX01_08035 [Chitinophagaceae bacterium]